MSNAIHPMRADYKDRIASELKETLGLKNPMEVPRISKITINMGIGEAAQDKKLAKLVQQELTAIAGQKSVIALARKSVAGFKIRDGWPVGCKVTLRGDRMYDFLQRLVYIALPTTRDFRGLNPKSFDGCGNYSFGVREQIIFPEIEYDKVDRIRGMDITITTTAKTNEQGLALLRAFKFPLKGSNPEADKAA